MNAIGIEYQQSYTIVCLRAGEGDAVETRLVSDGLRTVIPNLVAAAPQGDLSRSGVWGSQALRANPGTYLGESWLLPAGEARFWGALYARLETYLGGTPPTAAEGYACIVAEPQPVGYALRRPAPNARRGGYEPQACIATPDALICQWLSEALPQEPRTVVAVALGDAATEARAYRWEPRAPIRPRVRYGADIGVVPAGYSHWANRLRQLVMDHFPGANVQVDEMAFRDALDLCAQEVTRAPDGYAAIWKGPQRNRMAMRFHLSRAVCLQWEEALPLLTGLPNQIRIALDSLERASTPDLILLGGRGALWPFAMAALDGAPWLAPIPRRQSEHPVADVACGAAWWPSFASLLQPSASITGRTEAVVRTPNYRESSPTVLPPAVPAALPISADRADPNEEVARAVARFKANNSFPPFVSNEVVSNEELPVSNEPGSIE